MRRPIALATALVLALAVAACGRGEDRPRAVSASHGGSGSGSVSGSVSATAPQRAAFPVPPFSRSQADTVAEVEIVDFDYRFSVTTAKGPRLYLTLRNLGDLEHHFGIYPPSAADPVALWPPLAPGGYAEVGVELRPGTYLAKCTLAYGYQSHAARGERQEFTVR